MQNIVLSKLVGNLYGEPIKSELEYRNVYNYLDKYIKHISGSEVFNQVNPNVKENKTIWILWYQGMELAPKIVQQCFKSVLRNKPKDFDLIVLTGKNINDYIQLPAYVWEKFNKGIISKTHLSDIIRAELLSEYGGCWIDATVYCSEEIPMYMLSGDMFIFKWSLMDKSVLKMSSWWIYTKRDVGVIRDLRNLLFCYWKKEAYIRHYYLFHIMFSKVVDSNSFNQVTFRNIPYFSNSNPHVLYGKMAYEYNIDQWNILKDTSPVHKLSYKRKFMQGDIYNFYTALIENKLI